VAVFPSREETIHVEREEMSVQVLDLELLVQERPTTAERLLLRARVSVRPDLPVPDVVRVRRAAEEVSEP
jgi:hypothetical protein